MPSITRFSWVGFGVVIALHLALLSFLYQHRIVQAPRILEPLFVRYMLSQTPPKPVEPPAQEPPKRLRQDKPRPIERPKPQQLAVQAPMPLPEEPVVPAPAPTAPVVEPPPSVEPPLAVAPMLPPRPAELPAPVGPVTLVEELSVTCPERSAPAYPAQSRRLGEQGRVMLRVELDERGQVAAARVEHSSGALRLDDAALAAVRGWRCHPARRDGQAVRAVALQPFNFVLE